VSRDAPCGAARGPDPLRDRWRNAAAILFGTLLIGLMSALPSAAHADFLPALSLTKTANPTTYSAVGDVITYTYVIKNTGSLSLASLTLDDDRIANLNCTLPFILNSGDSVT
jgi:hypothetical protein